MAGIMQYVYIYLLDFTRNARISKITLKHNIKILHERFYKYEIKCHKISRLVDAM